jgi:hypothetical protein
MSRTALVAVIAGAVVIVVALAVITPTVLVDEHHDRHGARVRVMRVGPAPFPMPYPGREGFRRDRAPRIPGR